MTKKSIHVVTHSQWQVEEMKAKGWETLHSLGLEVPQHTSKDSWWMPQAYAVRFNKSLQYHAKPIIELTSPNEVLLLATPQRHAGRHLGVVSVYDALNSIIEWPDNLWWKMATAKRDDFICQPLTHAELMEKIQSLPMDSLLQYSEPLPPITSEHRFFILDRKIQAHSGYLKDGVTIYDGATFTKDENSAAYAKAQEVLADETFDMPKAFVMDVALTESGAFVLEYNPAWCSGWYDCEISGVMEVVRASSNPTKKELKAWRYQPDEVLLSSKAYPLPLA